MEPDDVLSMVLLLKKMNKFHIFACSEVLLRSLCVKINFPPFACITFTRLCIFEINLEDILHSF